MKCAVVIEEDKAVVLEDLEQAVVLEEAQVGVWEAE